MLTARVTLPATTQLPPDWKEQVAAVASGGGLEASDISRLPDGVVVFSLSATPAVGANEGRFDAAVSSISDQVRDFLAPTVPAYEERLSGAARRAADGQTTDVTGRELLSWFGAARRGARVVERIREALARHGLATEPDFNEVWVDVPLKLKALPPTATSPGAAPTGAPAGPRIPPPPSPQASSEFVHKVGRLAAANQEIVSVAPGTSVEEAMTIMMLHDYSQLPVMRTDRDCKGVVSWLSIGRVRALGGSCSTVDDCLLAVEEVSVDTGFLDVIPKVASRGFVLVRSKDRRYQGIITEADLSLQFRLLSEPFLLLGQIENYIRVLIRRAFTADEVRAAKDPADTSRIVNDVADLTLGECVRLLEPAAHWPKLDVRFARDPFLRTLRDVVDIRNDVMHFDPEPLEEDRTGVLRNFASFLEAAVGP